MQDGVRTSIRNQRPTISGNPVYGPRQPMQTPCEKNNKTTANSKEAESKPLLTKVPGGYGEKKSSPPIRGLPPSYAKGGRVKRTGNARVHKNEVVLPVALVKQLQNLMKK